MAANDQIKAFIDRVIRLKEEQDELSSDIRDVYAEAKAMGYDKTAMGEVVAYLRKVEKKGKDAIAERGAIFDMYLEAYERPSHTHAREDRPDAGLNILTKHQDIAGSSSGKASDFGSEDAGSIPAPASSSDQHQGDYNEVATGSAMRAGLADPTSNTGEGAANTALPTKPKVSFRPNCQHPENCASGTRDHCWSCRRSMEAA